VCVCVCVCLCVCLCLCVVDSLATLVVQKQLNKFPLIYSLAKALAAFDPQRMPDSSCHKVNRSNLRIIVKHNMEAGRISETDADLVHQQYTVLLGKVIKQLSYFATFNPTGSSAQQRD